MPPTNLNAAIEALLFSSDQPLPIGLMTEALDASADDVLAGLTQLGDAYPARESGVELREIAGGWMLVTTPLQAEWVGRLLRGKKKMRLSRAALETMAIIAYKQPVTKSEVEAIRGVDSSGVLATLMERNLITIRGRSKVVGRPLLYGTTQEFLEYFGLRDLTELPRPEELRALVAAREPEQIEMMELEVVSQVGATLAAADAAGQGVGAEHIVLPLDAEPPTAEELAEEGHFGSRDDGGPDDEEEDEDDEDDEDEDDEDEDDEDEEFDDEDLDDEESGDEDDHDEDAMPEKDDATDVDELIDDEVYDEVDDDGSEDGPDDEDDDEEGDDDDDDDDLDDDEEDDDDDADLDDDDDLEFDDEDDVEGSDDELVNEGGDAPGRGRSSTMAVTTGGGGSPPGTGRR